MSRLAWLREYQEEHCPVPAEAGVSLASDDSEEDDSDEFVEEDDSDEFVRDCYMPAVSRVKVQRMSTTPVLFQNPSLLTCSCGQRQFVIHKFDAIEYGQHFPTKRDAASYVDDLLMCNKLGIVPWS